MNKKELMKKKEVDAIFANPDEYLAAIRQESYSGVKKKYDEAIADSRYANRLIEIIDICKEIPADDSNAFTAHRISDKCYEELYRIGKKPFIQSLSKKKGNYKPFEDDDYYQNIFLAIVSAEKGSGARFGGKYWKAYINHLMVYLFRSSMCEQWGISYTTFLARKELKKAEAESPDGTLTREKKIEALKSNAKTANSAEDYANYNANDLLTTSFYANDGTENTDITNEFAGGDLTEKKAEENEFAELWSREAILANPLNNPVLKQFRGDIVKFVAMTVYAAQKVPAMHGEDDSIKSLEPYADSLNEFYDFAVMQAGHDIFGIGPNHSKTRAKNLATKCRDYVESHPEMRTVFINALRKANAA